MPVRWPRPANAAARLTDTVDLPTPPLPLAIASTRVDASSEIPLVRSVTPPRSLVVSACRSSGVITSKGGETRSTPGTAPTVRCTWSSKLDRSGQPATVSAIVTRTSPPATSTPRTMSSSVTGRRSSGSITCSSAFRRSSRAGSTARGYRYARRVVEPSGIAVLGPVEGRAREVLTPEALRFVATLHASFDAERRHLLGERVRRQEALDRGELPQLSEEAADDWRVPPAPADLSERKVEITGPVDRKMIINALNSGASAFMADFEDATSPTWANVVEGQVNLADAVAGTIELETPDKTYRVGPSPATLMVRPRGWHLPEKHVEIGGEAVSGSLFDFCLYVFHNARALLEHGSGPYFYLPKLESRHEAHLWASVFRAAEDALGVE